MSILKQVVFAGFAKQTAKGSAASAAAYANALTSGDAGSYATKEEVIETTSNKPYPFDAVRIEAVPSMDCTLLAQPRSVGLLLLGVLGTDVVTGGPTPYTHTITAAQDLPYFTVFGQVGSSDYLKFSDCKLDELTLSFKDAGKLEVQSKFIGCTDNWSGTPWTITNDERGQAFFQAAGGTFKLDGASGTPVTLPIKDASVKISRQLQAVMKASQVNPYDVAPGIMLAEYTVTVVPDDLTQIREVITGTNSGASVNQSLPYGSADLFWTFDANNDLDLNSGRIGWKVDLPKGDPKGGAAEVQFTGTALGTASNQALTAVLHNIVASY